MICLFNKNVNKKQNLYKYRTFKINYECLKMNICIVGIRKCLNGKH